ncbi:MAG: ABC transporter permease [Planctomycetes bacterium]|jgi:ABC-2 type transport system permease protein|nr:ABC transporter permease [Planctomycetota bacterium]
MNARVVMAVARTTFREFWRSPEAVFWTYGFPLVMAIVLGFSFQPKAPPPVPIAVVAGAGADQLAAVLRHNERFEVQVLDAAAADRAVARGKVALLVRGGTAAPVLRADPTRPEAELARLLVERTLRDERDGPGAPLPREDENRPGARYIDFLIPGLIGLNLLGAGMWGVGFNLVQMRQQHLLRRLFVTPLRPAEFLFGFMLGRFVLVLPEAAAIALFGTLLWGVPFRGSVLAATLLVVVGGLVFSGLGCLLASRARTTEGIGGLMNACSLPMWVLGGVFFDVETKQGFIRWIAELLPLTHLNRALRDVMLEPGGFAEIAVPFACLSLFGVVCFGLAMRWFRWT